MTTASCGMVDDPHRFEAMASQVASIDLETSSGRGAARGDQSAAEPQQTAAQQGLRPALSHGVRPAGLQVEVMDPHALWDARDDDLRGSIQTAAADAAPKIIHMAAPMALAAAETEVRARLMQASTTMIAPGSATSRSEGLRPASPPPATAGEALSSRATIQLGAYSSEAAARSAWTTVKSGAARQALDGLSPLFERVSVGGRSLIRLKVAAPANARAAICRAARVSDPWCARRT